MTDPGPFVARIEEARQEESTLPAGERFQTE